MAWLEGDSQGLQVEQCNVLNASVGTDGCVPVEMKEVIPFYYTCLWVSVRIFLEDTGRVAGRLKVQGGFSACVETIQSTQGGNGTHGSWLRTEIPFFCAWTQQSQTLKTMHIRDDSISVRLTEPLALEEEHFIHLFVQVIEWTESRQWLSWVLWQILSYHNEALLTLVLFSKVYYLWLIKT